MSLFLKRADAGIRYSKVGKESRNLELFHASVRTRTQKFAQPDPFYLIHPDPVHDLKFEYPFKVLWIVQNI